MAAKTPSIKNIPLNNHLSLNLSKAEKREFDKIAATRKKKSGTLLREIFLKWMADYVRKGY